MCYTMAIARLYELVKAVLRKMVRYSDLSRLVNKVYHQTELYASIILEKGGIFLPKMFTCEEVASRYAVQVITVWDWIRKKKLSAIKIGREYRISEEDIKAFEDSRRTTNNIY